MKHALLLLLLLSLIFRVAGQQVPAELKSKDYYLKKSRHQKLAAWPLMAAGLTLTTIGVYNAAAYGFLDALVGGNSRRANLGFATALVGLGATGGSLALFSAARRNKQRAADIDMHLEQLPITGMADHPVGLVVPALRLRIGL